MKIKKLWMSWSTGKDSAYAFHLLKRDPRFEVAGIFTTVTETYNRVSMHSTRMDLLQRQAGALDLPLEIVSIPAGCTDQQFENQMHILIKKAKASGIEAFGFGDLFLEDVRLYRTQMLAPFEVEPVFPLWNKSTKQLAIELIETGIAAILTCVDPKKLDPSFAGRIFNNSLLADLPSHVDPCGENGEFHTFVFESPDFSSNIAIKNGEVVARDKFIFADIIAL